MRSEGQEHNYFEGSRGRGLSYHLQSLEGRKLVIELVSGFTVIDKLSYVGDDYLSMEKGTIVPLDKVVLVELAQDEDTTEDSRDAEDYDRCYDDYDYWEWE